MRLDVSYLNLSHENSFEVRRRPVHFHAETSIGDPGVIILTNESTNKSLKIKRSIFEKIAIETRLGGRLLFSIAPKKALALESDIDCFTQSKNPETELIQLESGRAGDFIVMTSHCMSNKIIKKNEFDKLFIREADYQKMYKKTFDINSPEAEYNGEN